MGKTQTIQEYSKEEIPNLTPERQLWGRLASHLYKCVTTSIAQVDVESSTLTFYGFMGCYSV